MMMMCVCLWVCLWVRVCTPVEKVSVYVCLPLLPWVSNASCLWYLLTAIFEWCLLTVTVRSKALDTRGDCVCVRDITEWFSMIQAAHWKAGGLTAALTSQRIVCLCLSVCVSVCVSVCPTLWSSYHVTSEKAAEVFGPSNLETKQHKTTTNLMLYLWGEKLHSLKLFWLSCWFEFMWFNTPI